MRQFLPVYGLELVSITTDLAGRLGVPQSKMKELAIEDTTKITQLKFRPRCQLKLATSIIELKNEIDRINLAEDIPLFSRQVCTWTDGPVTTETLIPHHKSVHSLPHLPYLHLITHLTLPRLVSAGRDKTRHPFERIYWEKKRANHKKGKTRKRNRGHLILIFNMAMETGRTTSQLAMISRRLEHHFQGGATK